MLSDVVYSLSNIMKKGNNNFQNQAQALALQSKDQNGFLNIEKAATCRVHVYISAGAIAVSSLRITLNLGINPFLPKGQFFAPQIYNFD